MPNSITIDELAKIAKVSKSTVSKALNNKPDIGKKTKERILQIAREYDFIPHPFGRGLKNKITGNIGIIFCKDVRPLSANPFYSRVLEGVEAEVAMSNKNLMLQFVTESQTYGLPKMVKERQIDGLILIGNISNEYIELIKTKKIPFVLVDPKHESENNTQIVMDNEHGASIATRYLIENGHKKIGFISDDMGRLSFRQRFNGFVKSLRFFNISLNEDFVLTGGMEQGYEHMKKLLSGKEIPTAVFYTNDLNAHFGYKAIVEAGLRIPDDISLIGFDDIDLSRMSNPTLTTIRAYKEELGSIAVRTLLELIEDPELKPRTNIIPVKLVERNSVKNLKVKI